MPEETWRQIVKKQNGTLTSDQINDLVKELEEAQEAKTIPAEWGNCKRGCIPSYLNENGFCSPACERGQRRGE